MNQCISVTLTQGHRKHMEDTYIVTDIQKNKRSEAKLIAVFDGHGGDAVSNFCSHHFAPILQKYIANYPDMGIALRKTFQEVDERVKHIAQTCGSTAAIIVHAKGILWSANCGDSETMVSYKNGKYAMLSQSHKVDDELPRLKALGATITYDDGCGRLFRMLNLARSIGDYHLKKYVISSPYVNSVKSQDVDYILIGSDGLWDVWDATTLHQQINNLRHKLLGQGMNYSQMTDALNFEIVKMTLLKGSGDNITVIIYFL